MIEGIHRKGLGNTIPQIGYGYIVIPYNVERDLYVKSSLKKEKVCILPDQGSSYILDCYITSAAIKEIVFPKDHDSLGSGVIYVTNLFNNKPFIIGVVSKENESALNEEYKFVLEKRKDNNKVSIQGNAEDGNIIINVTNLEDSASLILNCYGVAPSSIKIQTNGKISVNSDLETEITSYEAQTFTSTNSDGSVKSVITINNEDITANPSGTFIIGEGEEPLALGDELQDQLNATNQYLEILNTNIENALTIIDGTAGSAGSPAFKSAQASNQLADFSNIKSNVSFTD